MAANDKRTPNLIRLTHGLSARAARFAMSTALRADDGARKQAATSALDRLSRLLKRRNSLYVQLFDLGWKDELPPVERSRHFRCPPYGALSEGHGKWLCHQPLVCPFCWVRTHTVPLLKRLMRVLFPDYNPADRRVSEKPFPELLEIISTHHYHRSHWGLSDIWDWASFRKGSLFREIARNAFGAYVCSSIVPDGPAAWLLKHRTLALVAPRYRQFEYKPIAPIQESDGCRLTFRLRRTTLSADDVDGPGPRMAQERQIKAMLREGLQDTPEYRQLQETLETPYDPLISLTGAVGRVTMMDHRLLFTHPEAVLEVLLSRKPPPGVGVSKYRTAEFYGVLRKPEKFGGRREDWIALMQKGVKPVEWQVSPDADRGEDDDWLGL